MKYKLEKISLIELQQDLQKGLWETCRSLLMILCIIIIGKTALLAYSPYFEKIKVGL
jgi:hypothetical protein